jgi:hypothetical protein
MVFGQLCMYANVAGTSKKVAVFGISYIGERELEHANHCTSRRN